ncbi:phosphatase PAP2 family protein [Alkalicoccus halolimnae]|uniref:Phosphatase PAP2 family protein n=1 Tax=Alkalicoccus halolimnae TaxID=1667239 RepID=A0A5C7FFF7_9BACI|nr:phosphatase PAP2 family protein [Alkalicoccus halolimnae]TXF84630.1 phosphatase PAP2 family protein [Alkalicoccus halolimnae]
MDKLTERLINYDESIFLYVNRDLRCRTLDILMPRLTHLGGAFFTLSLLLLLFTAGGFSDSYGAVSAFAALGLSHVAVHLLKKKYNRERPYASLKDVHLHTNKLKDYSFPSGHTTAAFSLAVLFSLYLPLFSVLFLPAAAVIMLSRIYLGLHYPSDCVSGVFIGSMAAISFYYIPMPI